MNDCITEFFELNNDIIDKRCKNKNRIIYKPNVDDPLEMKFRESTYRVYYDMAELDKKKDDLVPLDFEEEYAMELIVDLIKIYKNTLSEDALKERLYSYDDPIKEAIVDYQIMFYDTNDYEMIASILDYDLDDENDFNEFCDYMKLIEKAAAEGYRDVNNSHEIMYEIESNECFHELVKKTMKMNLIDSGNFVFQKERIFN